MFSDANFQPIDDLQQYVDSNENKYPGNYPKDEIPGLTAVALTDKPTDPTLVVTGFIIDKTYTQVWQTRKKTTDEITADTAAAAAQIIQQAGDPAIGLANLIAVLINKGVITADDLPAAQITATTDKLTQLGVSAVSVGVDILQTVGAGTLKVG